VARKVFLHVGLPKTGTTYLQTVMWADRPRMRAQGVLLPGAERRDHLWATRLVRGVVAEEHLDERTRTSWPRLVEEIAAWDGDAVVSHEFFAACTPEQAAGMVADLAPAEAHLVVTAREPLGLFVSGWQESLKNRHTWTFDEYAAQPASDLASAVWNWRTLDLRLVLERWSPAFEPERVHVLPTPRSDEPRDLLWQRFAGLVGLQPDTFDLSATNPNQSMGVVEAETLRRVNAHLATPSFEQAFDRGVYIRTFLADERLVTRGGERFWPSAAVVEECRSRGEQAVAFVVEHGFDVVGDVERLRVPERLEERRTVDSVTDTEVAGVAVELVARLLHDVRDLRRERNAVRRELEAERASEPSLRDAVRQRFPWARRFVKPPRP
jgi:hypothetical protein